MTNYLDNFKVYLKSKYVAMSIAVTLINFMFLAIALTGLNYDQKLEPLCFMALFMEVIYGIVILNEVKNKRKAARYLLPFLILNWFIGCFCLNVLMNVFEFLPTWVYIATFVFCFSNFIFFNQNITNVWTKIGLFVNGFTIILIAYYAIYLIPLAPISAMGTLVLGIGFYGLVPSVVLVIIVVELVDIAKNGLHLLNPHFAGLLSCLVLFGVFTYNLREESKKINQQSITKSFGVVDNDLPTYIKISQNLSPNYFNEIILKQNLVYVSTNNFFEFDNFRFNSNVQYNERKTHNPIYNLAYLFLPVLDLNFEDKVRILQANFDKRLETEEQLWSGEDVFAKNIKEDVKIFAKERLAYTEITMDLACEKQSWRPNEAIYSFELPENGVATSLSLWVNGIERKGVLTTKEKASKAYKQIVGVEARDPSLMQWKEGNRIVVRVFPINLDLPRTFKCGFTSPLKLKNNLLFYESITIKGPTLLEAETLSRIQVVENEKFEASKNFELNNGFYTNQSTGFDKWNVSVATSQNLDKSFVWEGNEYKIVPLEAENQVFVASEIVLDLNKYWKITEIESLLKIANKNFVTIKDKEKIAINKNNCKQVLEQFLGLEYSLLPFDKLSPNSLIVTKSGEISANFEELSTTEYMLKLKKNSLIKNIKVINISETINPFWFTVREQKLVGFLDKNLEETKNLIKKNIFEVFKKQENMVSVPTAKMSIVQLPANKNAISNGSNHLYRMYAFAKVLDNQIDIQSDSLAQNKYVDLAKDANIVTPISSLIVLETDKDYADNGIEKNVNTLGNADVNNDGAVPEPHEWVLIIIGFLSLLVYYIKVWKPTNKLL